MTSAFGVLANMGVRVAPTYILKVEDARGKVVWEHKDYEQKRVLDPGIAYIMTDILKDTTQPSRDFIFGSWTTIGRPAALKTGTTDNLKDVYSVGYVPQLVTGVWMGNNNGDLMSQRDFFSAMGPGVLWREYMKEVLTGVEAKDWERPANVVTANVVTAPGAFGGYGSGLLPSKLTPFATPEIFLKGTEPRTSDNWYVQSCPKPDGTSTVGMRVREVGPAVWSSYTQRWIADAKKGGHSYGRYSWSLVTEEACPSPSATPSPTPSPSGPPRPSGSPGPSPSPGAPGSTPASTPTFDPFPRPSVPLPVLTFAPTPTPTRTPNPAGNAP
jgi:membrane peptidoglycan carboxypeptidase